MVFGVLAIMIEVQLELPLSHGDSCRCFLDDSRSARHCLTLFPGSARPNPPPCSAKDSPEGLGELDRLNSPLYLYNLLDSRLDVTIAVLGCQLQCPSVHHAPGGRERNDRPRSAVRYSRFLVEKSGCV